MMSSPGNHSHQQGEHAEALACAYLEQQGLTLLKRNFRCRQGEIDLIMQDDETIVFVEVKYRKSTRYGGAAAAVSASKQQKVLYTARYFLARQGLSESSTACRFDVLTLEGSQPQIHWIQNAFIEGS